MANKFAQTKIQIADNSKLVAQALNGVIAVMGVTERGALGSSKIARSWEEYKLNFGGLLADTKSIFPLMCKRALDAGAILRVSRILHWADITDISTVDATKATGDNSGTYNFDYRVIAVNVAGLTVTVLGDATPYLGIGDTVTTITSAGTVNLPTTVSSITFTGGSTVIGLAAVAVDVNGKVTFSTTIANTISYDANEYGTYGNSISVAINPPSTGTAGVVDITIALAGYPELTEELKDFPTSPSATELAQYNQGLNLITILAAVGVVPTPEHNLTLGAEDTTVIDALDYQGNTNAATGLHSFDAVNDFTKIAVPAIAQNVVDKILADYVILRGDCLGLIRTPTGLATGRTWADYRYQLGAFTGGVAIDLWQMLLFGGDVLAINEDDDTSIDISILPDVMGKMTLKDNLGGSWTSFSGLYEGAGVFDPNNNLGVTYNLGIPARKVEAQDVAKAGVNYAIDYSNSGAKKSTVSWGNSTLQTASTLLQNANIAELFIYLKRTIKPITDGQLFRANSISTWKDVYRAVNLLMRTLKDAGAIEAYQYDGDQFIDNITEAIVNQPANIAAGIYKFNLRVVPTTLMEEVDITISVENTSVAIELANA